MCTSLKKIAQPPFRGSSDFGCRKVKNFGGATFAEILQIIYFGSIKLKGFSVLFFVVLALLLIYKADLFPEAALKAQVKGYRSDHKADST